MDKEIGPLQAIFVWLMSVAFGISAAFAAPITFALLAYDTWSARTDLWVKLLMTVTVDLFLAAIWPITWIIWVVIAPLIGWDTPLSRIW